MAVRRKSSTVRVGSLTIGGDAPVRVQSMTTTDTGDVEQSTVQALRIIKAGGELVRLTTQGVREAESIGRIKQSLVQAGQDTPVVADVHFNRNAAMLAAANCDKVRINPGNFADAARTFKQLTYTEREYRDELVRIEALVLPFLEECRAHGTAVRLGINHGSLSDRIMSRYGDSPQGMCESAMEYLRICKSVDFDNVVVSMKSSNTAVMADAVRCLVQAMDAEDMHFPLHLGVTEAGNGREGRIKSAVGIGTLLSQGIGDTIRVSLSEAPEDEIPVAKALIEYINSRKGDCQYPVFPMLSQGGTVTDRVIAMHADYDSVPDDWEWRTTYDAPVPARNTVFLLADEADRYGSVRRWVEEYRNNGGNTPVIVHCEYADALLSVVELKAAADMGPLLMDGFVQGIGIESALHDTAQSELMILQAARKRFTRTEYIACPGCGRTLFDLQGTLEAVKKATSGYPGLKIAVMGCIVNGPGEMADADYGYVGASRGRISLYRGKECVQKNIPQEEAIPRLMEILQKDGFSVAASTGKPDV